MIELALDPAEVMLEHSTVGALGSGEGTPRDERPGGDQEDENDDESDQHRAAERSAAVGRSTSEHGKKGKKMPDPASPKAYRI
jgi:hypothetical protein